VFRCGQTEDFTAETQRKPGTKIKAGSEEVADGYGFLLQSSFVLLLAFLSVSASPR
jgi:hypothetical protein